MKRKNKEITAANTRLTKTMGRLRFTGGLVSLVAVAMAFGMSGIARAGADNAGQSCSEHTLRGSYLFATHGFNIVGGVMVPKAIVEGIDFNGNGTLSSPFATVSLNGTIIRSSGTVGSYTVAADCTGTLTFSGGPSFDIFVEPSGDGKQVWMIQTGPAAAPAVFQGTAIKVSP
jgi:hypothetical protein